MSIVALILITRHVFALLFITRHLFTRHSKLLTRLWCVKQLLYPVGFFLFFKATSYQIEEVSYFQMFSTSECCQVLSNALLRGLRWSVFAPLSILWERWLALLVSLISDCDEVCSASLALAPSRLRSKITLCRLLGGCQLYANLSKGWETFPLFSGRVCERLLLLFPALFVRIPGGRLSLRIVYFALPRSQRCFNCRCWFMSSVE